MQVAANTYLSSILFSDLFSWDVKSYLSTSNQFNQSFHLVLFGHFLNKASIQKIKIEDDVEYKILGVRSYGKGAFANRIVKGKTLKMREYQKAKSNHLFWCKVDTKNGAFGVIKEDLADGIGSSNMTFAEINTEIINIDYLQLLFSSIGVMRYLDSFVTGTTNRKYIRPDQLLNEIKIPLPSLVEQEKIVKNYYSKIDKAEKLIRQANDLESKIERYLFKELGIEKTKAQSKNIGLQLINFSDILEWGVDKLFSKSNKSSSKYPLISINSFSAITINLLRGKSPKYKKDTSAFILNQKCNRWNNIDLSFVKTVDEDWLKSIPNNFLTKEGDVLINSTGDGTIGRASFITKELEGLLYDSHILLLRLNPTLINAELFVEIFNSEYGQNQVNEIKSAQATKQTELGISNLSRIKFPLVENLKTQNEIVNKIKEMRFRKNNLINQVEQLKFQAEKEFEQTIFR